MQNGNGIYDKSIHNANYNIVVRCSFNLRHAYIDTTNTNANNNKFFYEFFHGAGNRRVKCTNIYIPKTVGAWVLFR